MQGISYTNIQLWGMACLFLCISSLLPAQSFERKVFSAGGSSANIGLHNYAYTFGEPIIGTDESNLPYLTKGFHQPAPNPLLAVEFSFFEGRLEGEDAWLDWGFRGFPFPIAYELERSADLIQKQLLVRVEAESKENWTYTDRRITQLPVQKMYYRIRGIMANGSSFLSQWVSISWSTNSDFSLSAYPNPATDILHIESQLSQDMPLQIQMFTSLGQLVYEEKPNALKGTFKWDIHTDHLTAGMYRLLIQSPMKRESLSIRIIH